ncbi:MAG: hypothetical protein KY455_03860 [Euryarchaeota archaeon]|nr:hypothetical protein [Euryarchaeota archaeon]
MAEVPERNGPSVHGVFTFSAITWLLGATLVVVAFFMILSSNAMVDDPDEASPGTDEEASEIVRATHRASLAKDLGDIGIWFTGIGTAGLVLSTATAAWTRVYETEE